MKITDIFHKIVIFLKGDGPENRNYSIRNIDIRLRDVPYSMYLVLKKYGCLCLIGKSFNYIVRFFKKFLGRMISLYDQAAFSNRKEGFGKMALRILNYIFYGKGVLSPRDIRLRRQGSKPKVYNIAHIDALNLDTIEEINFPLRDTPKVSVIIPAFNKWKFTYNCLDSLKKNIGSAIYEIIVVDDGSVDGTEKMMEKIRGVTYVKNERNLGFVGSCNAGAKKARGEYLVFLNNDTAIKKKWLRSLLETFQNNENIGFVGSKLIYPDGRLQEAGGIVWKNENVWNYGRYENPNDPEFNYLKDVDYCSGASIMVPRVVFEKLNGFDPIFSPGYCEDSDLAFRIRQSGLRTVYQPKSELFHFEGITSGTDLKNGMKKYQTANSKKFFVRWRETLKKENSNDIIDGPFLARDRSQRKKTILIIDHYVPTFDKDAGSRTVYQYIKLFCELGYNVKFIGDNFLKIEPYTTALQQLGVEVLYGEHFQKNWANWLGKNASYIEFIFLNRPHIFTRYIDQIKKLTHAKIVYYGHDLHFLRIMREYGLTKNKYLLSESRRWKKMEFEIFKKADLNLYPSKIEVDEIKKTMPDARVQALPAYMYDNKEFKYDAKGRKDILFVGGFSHLPNIDAVKWFCRDIFPMVLRIDPSIKFHIVGSNPTKEVLELASESVVVRGFVTDEELTKIYNTIRMTVAPLRYGAGIKGKVIEAMYRGVPVITTNCGAEGIDDGSDMLVAIDQAEGMANEICIKYNDYGRLNGMSMLGKDFVNENYSMDSAIKKIKEIF